MITNDPLPAKPSALAVSSVGLGTVTLNWAAADPGIAGASIVSYQINAFDSAAATTAVKTVETGNADTSAVITGLEGDREYWFTVSPKRQLGVGSSLDRVTATPQVQSWPMPVPIGPEWSATPR